MNKTIVYLSKIRRYLIIHFLFNFILIFMFPLLPDLEHFEFPKGKFENTLITQNGHIFVGNDNYQRIQKFDQNGNFLKGWFIEPPGSAFLMAMDDKGIIHVLVARVYFHIEYHQNGELISQTQLDDESYLKLNNTMNSRTVNEGLIKAARSKIKTPFYWYPFMLFTTTIIISFAMIIISFYIERKKKIEFNK